MHPRGIKKRRLKKAARSPVKKEAASGKRSKRSVISPPPPRPPMGGGGRLAAHVRPSRRTQCFMRSLGRSDEDTKEKRPRLPGRPARRVGPLLAEQRHFSGYSFGAKRVPLRSSSVSRRKARCHLTRMEPVKTSSNQTLCPIPCAAKRSKRPAGRMHGRPPNARAAPGHLCGKGRGREDTRNPFAVSMLLFSAKTNAVSHYTASSFSSANWLLYSSA